MDLPQDRLDGSLQPRYVLHLAKNRSQCLQTSSSSSGWTCGECPSSLHQGCQEARKHKFPDLLQVGWRNLIEENFHLLTIQSRVLFSMILFWLFKWLSVELLNCWTTVVECKVAKCVLHLLEFKCEWKFSKLLLPTFSLISWLLLDQIKKCLFISTGQGLSGHINYFLLAKGRAEKNDF